MKFKRNVVATLIVNFTFSFLFLSPSIWMLFIYSKEENIFLIIISTLLCILIMDLIYYLFNLIAMIFTKIQVYVYDTYFQHLHYKVNYLDVKKIIFDLGIIGKTGSTPCSITFFDEEYRMLSSIDNPSFIMMFIVLSRCKNAKVSITGYKIFMWLGIGFFIISLLLPLFI